MVAPGNLLHSAPALTFAIAPSLYMPGPMGATAFAGCCAAKTAQRPSFLATGLPSVCKLAVGQ